MECRYVGVADRRAECYVIELVTAFCSSSFSSHPASLIEGSARSVGVPSRPITVLFSGDPGRCSRFWVSLFPSPVRECCSHLLFAGSKASAFLLPRPAHLCSPVLFPIIVPVFGLVLFLHLPGQGFAKLTRDDIFLAF